MRSSLLTLAATALFTSLSTAALNCSSYEASSLGLHHDQSHLYIYADSFEPCIPFCAQYPEVTNWWYDSVVCNCFVEEPTQIVHIDGFWTGFCTEEEEVSSSSSVISSSTATLSVFSSSAQSATVTATSVGRNSTTTFSTVMSTPAVVALSASVVARNLFN